MSDSVNKPNHYTSGGVECIDGIRAALGESFVDYCRGNVLKYVWRCGKKGDAVEDLRKAAKYLQWAIEALEGNASEVPNSSLPDPGPGYRLLSKDPPEVVIKGDEFYFDGKWEESGNWSANGLQAHSYYYRRMIEPAEWIPKVGDKVRVVKPLRANAKHPHWPPEMDEWNGRFGVVSKLNLELRTVLIDGFEDRDGYQWRFSFDWLRYEGGASEAAK